MGKRKYIPTDVGYLICLEPGGVFILEPWGGEKVSEKAINAKKEVVEEIKEKINTAQSATLVEFNKINVKEISELRNQFRDANVEYKVYKNSLLRFAFEQLGFDQFEEELTGSNALILSYGDVIDGPKVADKFIEEDDQNKERLIIKSGIVDGVYQSPDQMKAISKLPAKEQLAGMLVYTLQAPIKNLAIDLNETNAKIVYALNAIKEQKEKEEA